MVETIGGAKGRKGFLRTRIAPILACVLALLATGALPASAASIWYVNASAAAGGDGTTLAKAFQTIAKGTTAAANGDTVLIYTGMYRESVSLTKNITIKAQTGARVQINEMGNLGTLTWTTYSGPTLAPAGAVLTTVAPFKLKNLYADLTEQPLARVPAAGQPWATVTAASGTNVTVSASLGVTIASGTAKSAFAYVLSVGGNGFGAFPIASVSGTTVTLASSTTAIAVGDRLVIANHPSLIHNWQDCAYADNGNGTTTVWWDQVPGNTHTGQSSLNSTGINGLGCTGAVVDGVEVYGATNAGIVFNNMTNSTIQNCLIHDNGFGEPSLFEGEGIKSITSTNTLIQNCLISTNMVGLTSASDSGLTLKQCEVAYSAVDGFDISQTNSTGPLNSGLTVENCYFHGQMEISHPDCIQSYGQPPGSGHKITNMTIKNNFVGLTGGQNLILADCDNLLVTNNVIAGGGALEAKLDEDFNSTFTSNTFALGASGAFYPSGDNTGTLSNLNGVFYHSVMPADDSAGVGILTSSNYDFFWNGTDAIYSGTLGGVFTTWYGNPTGSQLGLPQLFADFGYENNSTAGTSTTPMFTNVPTAMGVVSQYIDNSTTTSLILQPGGGSGSLTGHFAVGDTIEVNDDGIARTISAVDWTTYTPVGSRPKITFAPAISNGIPLRAFAVWDWPAGTTNLALDYRPVSTSPILGGSSTGGQRGSTINTVQYAAGSFDGTGTRNIPAMPGDLHYYSYQTDPYDGP